MGARVKEIGKIKDLHGDITIVHLTKLECVKMGQPGGYDGIDFIQISNKNIKKLITILKKIK